MKTKVLHLIDSGGLYGAERMLLALAAEQIGSEIEPMILSAGVIGEGEKAIETEARRMGIPLISWRMKPGLNPVQSLKILRWAKSEGVQLFHSHGYKFNVLIGLWPESVRKIPLIATLHGYIKAKKFTKSWFYELVDRFFLDRMRSVVLVSSRMKDEIPDRLSESNRVEVIPNGLNFGSLVEASDTPLEEKLESFIGGHYPVLLGVGRLSREKGFDLLIKAFKIVRAQYPDSRLLIIGDGYQRDDLESIIDELGLTKSVCLYGYFDNSPALMKRSDLLCMPSLNEGLPITLLEAMAIGLPICASKVGEIESVLGNGQGGTLCSTATASKLALDILRALNEQDRTRASALWSKQTVHDVYSAKRMMESYLKVYTKVLE